MKAGHVLLQRETNNNLSITIRNLTSSDITLQYCNWLNDKETNQYLESRFTEWDMQSLLNYYLITHDPQPASRADMASEGLPRLHAPIQPTCS